MFRQPIAGFLLLSAAVAGAFATDGNQDASWWDETGHPWQSMAQVQPARKLDPTAAARARAEWEEVLRTANVRLMAFERIREQPAASPEVIQDPTGQQIIEPAAPRTQSRQNSVPKLAPAAQQSEEGRSARAARNSRAKAIASSRTKSAEAWSHSFISQR